ncbi:2-keto-4-pentenoate hydratase [Pinisolibacter aquiterrae]|uniref:2-keto-4-pentenoate hydratase n=1 Tax=Pinisolibacter aquiterrae TaxID=2815579 RepID=UPI001C3D8D5E|nr:fumarylacetoacetate hydrolase family protein [Pinisolibacter aquiterrae]MBV5263005.1 fumarylacetoacetate hydrolase family protein [Pinisolibacter aquiterrae]MCC8236121.1 fumarylacetoacetate hydrolase family protein [Pinisolibacter aquiterrae]
MTSLAGLAQIVDEAARTAVAIPQLTDTLPDLTVDDAYAIQALSVARRRARGERRAGFKMGLTSRAKMIQVGVSEVIWGRLTDAMRLIEGGDLHRAAYVHPRVEPEIAYILKKPLEGEVTAAEALSALEAIAPAVEIIDSRYRDFKFALPDVVADNSSSSGFFVGSWSSPSTDVTNLGIVMEVDGRPVQIGSTAAILGNPIRSLVAAARLVAKAGERLEPGDIVLAGGATAAHALVPGMHVKTTFQRLGTVAFNVVA